MSRRLEKVEDWSLTSNPVYHIDWVSKQPAKDRFTLTLFVGLSTAGIGLMLAAVSLVDLWFGR